MNFVRGDNTKTVRLEDILPQSMKNFSTMREQESFAKSWEERHNVLVRRPWEDAEVFAQRAQEKSAEPKAATPEVGMSVDRAEKELKRYIAEYVGGGFDEKRKVVLEREINRLETLLHIAVTNFAAAARPATAPVTDEVDPVLQKKVNRYLTMPQRNRVASIRAISDRALLQLLAKAEEDDALLQQINERLATL